MARQGPRSLAAQQSWFYHMCCKTSSFSLKPWYARSLVLEILDLFCFESPTNFVKERGRSASSDTHVACRRINYLNGDSMPMIKLPLAGHRQHHEPEAVFVSSIMHRILPSPVIPLRLVLSSDKQFRVRPCPLQHPRPTCRRRPGHQNHGSTRQEQIHSGKVLCLQPRCGNVGTRNSAL